MQRRIQRYRRLQLLLSERLRAFFDRDLDVFDGLLALRAREDRVARLHRLVRIDPHVQATFNELHHVGREFLRKGGVGAIEIFFADARAIGVLV